MSDLINRIRQAQIRAAEDVVIGSLAPELIADPRDAALATAPDSFVERAMELATDASVHAEARAHRFCNGSLNQLRAHLERQAARCKELEEALKFFVEHPGVWALCTENSRAMVAARSALSAPKEQST